MCSRQTGLSGNLTPKVCLKRLSSDDLQHFNSQGKQALTKSQDNREAKRVKLILDKKRKKKKIGLCTNVQMLLRSSERRSNLRSRNKSYSLHNVINTLQKSSNHKNIKELKKKTVKSTCVTEHVDRIVKRNDNILSSSTDHSTCSTSISSKQSFKSNTKPTNTVKECIQQSTRESASIYVSNKINYGPSSRKRSRLRHYRITHNIASRMPDTPDISEEYQENTTKGNQILEHEPVIQTAVVYGKESEDEEEDDEITVIGERTKNAMGKIINQPIKLEKCDAKILRFNRANIIANLIDENKTLSIAVQETQQGSENCSNITNNGTPEVESQKSDDIERTSSCGKIKLKSPKSLGIGATKTTGDDCSAKFMKYEMVTGDTTVANICRTFIMYFNDSIKKLIGSLIKTLELLILELACDPKLAFLLPTLSKDIEFEKEYFESTLKKYSGEFTETFKLIINEFDDKDKSKMIPIVYLLIIKAFENSNLITQEGIHNCFLKVFTVEHFECTFDALYAHNTWQKAKELLSIFERWVKSTIDLNVFKVSPEFMHNQAIPKLIEENICLSDEKSSKEKENILSNITLESNLSNNEDSISIEQKSDQKEGEDWNIICLLENITQNNLKKTDCDSVENCYNSVDCNNVTKSEQEDYFHPPDEEDFPDCLYEGCSKKQSVLCDYCKKPFTCVDLCQVDPDQVIKSMQSEYRIEVILSCKLHRSLVYHHPYYIEESSEEKIKFSENAHRECTKEQEMLSEWFVNDKNYPECSNEACPMEISTSCYYCKDPVTCRNLCQVHDERIITIRINDGFKTVLVSCDHHQKLIRNYIFDTDQAQDEDSEMHRGYTCWVLGCDKAGLIICVCKTRPYCSTTCQKEDWVAEHHKNCIQIRHNTSFLL